MISSPFKIRTIPLKCEHNIATIKEATLTHYVTYFLLLMCSFCACANEQFPDPKWEYSQKAKIIRYLTEIVTWPTSSNANQNFNVCLVGKFSHVSILKQLDKKTD